MRRIDSVLAAVVLVPILLVGLVVVLTTCAIQDGPAEKQAEPPGPECPDCPVPTPCPVPFPDGELWVGTVPRPPQPLGVAQAHELFPIQHWEPILEPMYAFTAEQPGIRVADALAGVTGTVRLALARPVPDVGAPPLPGDVDPGEWALLVPCTEDQCVRAWQEAITVRIPPDGGPAGNEMTGSEFASLVIERQARDVIPFANDGSSFQASVRSLAPVLLARRAGDAGGLWIEALLVQQCNVSTSAPCNEPCGARRDAQWALYHFGSVPPPSDGDRRRAYCCDWLRCGTLWHPECTLHCAGVACP